MLVKIRQHNLLGEHVWNYQTACNITWHLGTRCRMAWYVHSCRRFGGTSNFLVEALKTDVSGFSFYNNNNNNNNNTYLPQLGCYPVAVVILHVNKT